MSSEPAFSLKPANEKLLDVVTHATARLNLYWSVEREKSAPGRLNERFLWGQKRSPPTSLSFLANLYKEVEEIIIFLFMLPSHRIILIRGFG